MSKVTKCDICGAIDDGRKFDFAAHFAVPVDKVPIKRRGIFSPIKLEYEYKDVDVCVDCLKLLKEKAKEV